MQLRDRVLDPPVLLAPMAGLTDRPFRGIVARFGAGLVVSEMLASRELLARALSALARAEVAAGAAANGVGTAVQIAGWDPGAMAEAARWLAGDGAAVIDINMGCPAKKVARRAAGAGLMREPELALAVVEAVVGAVDVPVTVKMRLGWDEGALNAPELAARAEAAGVAMVTVHGRTRCQFYGGRADWRAIGRVVRAVRIPVVANGDIVDAATARCALAASGAAGVMVGRGAVGRPWALAGIAAGLAGRPLPGRPRGADFAALVAGHLEAALSFYGTAVGIRAMRKHLDGYLAQVPGTAALRGRLIREDDPRRLLAGIAELGALDAEAPVARAA